MAPQRTISPPSFHRIHEEQEPKVIGGLDHNDTPLVLCVGFD
jgi:hypothetical protein